MISAERFGKSLHRLFLLHNDSYVVAKIVFKQDNGINRIRDLWGQENPSTDSGKLNEVDT